MKHRVIFVDLHCNMFLVRTLSHILFKHSVALKHDFLLKRFLNDERIEVCNFVTRKDTSVLKEVNFGRGLWKKTWPHLSWLENWLVLHHNHLSIKTIYSVHDIRPDDIVVGYMHYLDGVAAMKELCGLKIVSLLHLYGEKEEADLLQEVSPDILFSEAYLNKYSALFRKNFSWYRGRYILMPFKYQPRFCAKKTFSERKIRAIAMGTVTGRDTPEFIETYGSSCYQPLRQQILDNKDMLSDIIDCYISPFIETNTEIPAHANLFQRIYKKFENLYAGQQKKYFSFDMVEKYNEYKMVVCPEDVQGMPGIGFVEAMACGCAYIGLDYGAYRDLGLIAGKHFIGYDGSLSDLRQKVEYYMKPENQEALSKIAADGMAYVCEHFSEDAVAEHFVQELLGVAGGRLRDAAGE